jgi:serine/threonine protein phosphatase PrpC
LQVPLVSHSMLIIEAEAATRRGPSHVTNEDAFVADARSGLFVVADGMGGHRDGQAASNAIVSILAHTFDADASFEEKVDAAALAISSVNASLYAPCASDPGLDISGSTVVSLIIADGYAACLWVGDSRLYLFRDSELYLISEDHAAHDRTLTRAVGSAPTIDIDRRIVEVRAGDVFLLASDGLNKGASERQISHVLDAQDEGAAERLINKAIEGGAMDDITVVLVWVDRVHG